MPQFHRFGTLLHADLLAISLVYAERFGVRQPHELPRVYQEQWPLAFRRVSAVPVLNLHTSPCSILLLSCSIHLHVLSFQRDLLLEMRWGGGPTEPRPDMNCFFVGACCFIRSNIDALAVEGSKDAALLHAVAQLVRCLQCLLAPRAVLIALPEMRHAPLAVFPLAASQPSQPQSGHHPARPSCTSSVTETIVGPAPELPSARVTKGS